MPSVKLNLILHQDNTTAYSDLKLISDVIKIFRLVMHENSALFADSTDEECRDLLNAILQ